MWCSVQSLKALALSVFMLVQHCLNDYGVPKMTFDLLKPAGLRTYTTLMHTRMYMCTINPHNIWEDAKQCAIIKPTVTNHLAREKE